LLEVADGKTATEVEATVATCATRTSSLRKTSEAAQVHPQPLDQRQTDQRAGRGLQPQGEARQACGTALPESRSLCNQRQTQTRSVFQNRQCRVGSSCNSKGSPVRAQTLLRLPLVVAEHRAEREVPCPSRLSFLTVRRPCRGRLSCSARMQHERSRQALTLPGHFATAGLT